ncbi:CTD small phosphatase-like protein [Astathelohania contejeani]|uniref:CTD small phosphatase-like protein n=1 Tax=Astathelohania contejeani TaxID=164912 RepID=A0ABQ7I0R6_9MICR|nr:CTD small phosphatase-like protein [Thelohania contejeani]
MLKKFKQIFCCGNTKKDVEYENEEQIISETGMVVEEYQDGGDEGNASNSTMCETETNSKVSDTEDKGIKACEKQESEDEYQNEDDNDILIKEEEDANFSLEVEGKDYIIKENDKEGIQDDTTNISEQKDEEEKSEEKERSYDKEQEDTVEEIPMDDSEIKEIILEEEKEEEEEKSIVKSYNKNEENSIEEDNHILEEPIFQKIPLNAPTDETDNFHTSIKNHNKTWFESKKLSFFEFINERMNAINVCSEITINSKINSDNLGEDNIKSTPYINTKPKSNLPTLVLDLDETLVYSSFLETDNYTHKINVLDTDIWVSERPYLGSFLETLAQCYELIIFTAGRKEYADKVINSIDPRGLIAHRLYRESCTFHGGRYVKDLSKLGRDLKKTILIDNSVWSSFFQPENSYLIKSYIGANTDKELYKLMEKLAKISKEEDLRIALMSKLFKQI